MLTSGVTKGRVAASTLTGVTLHVGSYVKQKVEITKERTLGYCDGKHHDMKITIISARSLCTMSRRPLIRVCTTYILG